MNKVWKIASWVLAIASFFLVLSFVRYKQSQIIVKQKDWIFHIKHHNNSKFVNKNYIKSILKARMNYDLDSMSFVEINLNAIEKCLDSLPEVQTVQVYKNVKGQVHIQIEEKEPILRVFHKGGVSNYITSDGKWMDLSSNFTAFVPVATGNIDESNLQLSVAELNSKPKLSQQYLMDDLYRLAKFIYKDEFWKAQIEEIHVTEKNEFELIPRVGDHRIVLGDLSNMRRKFKKLKVFYEEGLNKMDWNAYSILNLKFKNQVVCTKK